MPSVALLLDEDVRVLLAQVLRQRGYDVVHVLEAGRTGLSDLEQLEYAVAQGRCVLTHNIRDFVVVHKACQAEGRDHAGIIVSDQLPFRELLRRSLRCMSRLSTDDMRNRLVWLHDYK